jgi:hypothetical protein
MAEAEWLRCTDVRALVELLPRGIGKRKTRLFACACCRGIGNIPGDTWCGRAIDIVERFVDGSGAEKQWESAKLEVLRAIDETRDRHPYPDYLIRPEHAARWAVRWLLDRGSSTDTMSTVASAVAQAVGILALMTARDYPVNRDVRLTAEARERERQCRLLREIVGNPFRPVSADPSWLSWREGTIPIIAEGIYEERAFDRLPILADALEDAGCTNEDVLNHCREPGEHTRGCWVVDLLTGRN